MKALAQKGVEKPAFLSKSMKWIVFFAGATTMMLEFAASRLLGNVYGTSNLVWAVIIGLILIYMTLGNWLGGIWADRSPKMETLGFILALAAVATAIVPIIARPVLRLGANAFDELNIGQLAGSFISVIVLFIAPVSLLGMVTPFAIRLSIKTNESSGKISGQLSAISTLGSFLGTFLTVLALIPLIGTNKTFIVIAVLLLLLSLPSLLKASKWWIALVITSVVAVSSIAVLLGFKGFEKPTSGIIYETESAYNYIQILEESGFRFLRLNEGQGMHSIYHPARYFYGGPWSQVLVAPFFNQGMRIENVKSMALIGLAAGTTARQASVALPDTEITGIEIDPEIVFAAQKYMGMDLPNLKTIVGDGRWEIYKIKDKQFDVISVDAYRPPYIPAQMVTREFFQLLSSRLSDQGVVVINVGRSGKDRSLVDDLASTMSQVFPRVFAAELPESFNTILFACKSDHAGWEALRQNFMSMEFAPQDGESVLKQAMSLTLQSKVEPSLNAQIFTDDLAPIELITNRMVLNFLGTPE